MQNIIFLPLEKVFKIKPGGEKHIPEILEKKLEKKLFFPVWLWSDFRK